MDVRKNVICKKDYERYSVKMPFRVFLSRNRSRDRFLFGELEKLHPCFSDECTFDSKFKFGKKGLLSDVVVMNRLKLSEYKAQAFGNRLFLEENPEKSVFKKRGKPVVLIISMAALAFVCCLVMALSNLHKTRLSNGFVGNQSAPEDNFEADDETYNYHFSFEGKFSGELTNLFLSAIEGDSAFLSELEWKCDGINESFFASVGYIHPDRLMNNGDFELSSVNYKDNVPFFTAKGKCKIRRSDMNQTELVWSNGKNGVFDADEEVFSEFRKIISSAGAEFLEENFNPWKIRFVLKDASLEQTENLISEMAGYVLKMGIAIRRLVIRKGGFDDFELEIETAPDLDPYMGVNLNILEKRFRLFGLKTQREKVQSYQIAVEKKNTEPLLDNPGPPELRKIGEIRHKDGSFVVYFKNKQGKIVSEMGK